MNDVLISVSELDRRSGEDIVIFDCRFNLADPDEGESQWRRSHVPGARYAHLDRDLASAVTESSGRHPLPDPGQFAQWLGDNGVSPERQVVAYDGQGSAIAARLWWLLRWVGHQRVRVLDGGFKAWQDAGLALEVAVPKPRSKNAYPVAPDQAMAVTADELAELLLAKQVRLLDARAAPRFRGESEPLDKVAGHVPGAVNHPFMDDLASGEFRGADELRAGLLEHIHPFDAASTVCMCGSGVTACHTLLALEIAGLPGARLYPGSWSEWIADSTRPVAAGD